MPSSLNFCLFCSCSVQCLFCFDKHWGRIIYMLVLTRQSLDHTNFLTHTYVYHKVAVLLRTILAKVGFKILRDAFVALLRIFQPLLVNRKRKRNWKRNTTKLLVVFAFRLSSSKTKESLKVFHSHNNTTRVWCSHNSTKKVNFSRGQAKNI